MWSVENENLFLWPNNCTKFKPSFPLFWFVTIFHEEDKIFSAGIRCNTGIPKKCIKFDYFEIWINEFLVKMTHLEMCVFFAELHHNFLEVFFGKAKIMKNVLLELSRRIFLFSKKTWLDFKKLEPNCEISRLLNLKPF